MTKTIEEKFWPHVEKGDGCWTWRGPIEGDGYGRVYVNRSTHVRAHRVSWEIHRGPIPEGMQVCHHCDNPPCVNPEHLFLGDTFDNIFDAAKKKRMRRKLTDREVAEIRALVARGLPIATISRMYGVVRSHVRGLADQRCRTASAEPVPTDELPPHIEIIKGLDDRPMPPAVPRLKEFGFRTVRRETWDR